MYSTDVFLDLSRVPGIWLMDDYPVLFPNNVTNRKCWGKPPQSSSLTPVLTLVIFQNALHVILRVFFPPGKQNSFNYHWGVFHKYLVPKTKAKGRRPLWAWLELVGAERCSVPKSTCCSSEDLSLFSIHALGDSICLVTWLIKKWIGISYVEFFYDTIF